MGLPRHRVEATADDGMVVVTLPRPRLRSVSPPLMAAVAVVLVATGSAALPDGGDKTVREASVPERLTHPVVVALDDAVPASWSHELLTDVAPPPAPATGTRAVDVARLAGQGIPEVALAAYRAAAASLAQADPGCHLDWALLAGIGRVESFHGRFGGSSAGTDGVVSPPIIGVPLDGGPGIATITDTDDGSLDGDTVHDRAVGPMQFIPGTWAGFGVDGDGDGRADPQNLFDAALSAGTYLCAGEGDLIVPDDRRRAVERYNNSDSYVDLVLAIAAAYAAGTSIDTPATPLVPPPAVPTTAPARPASTTDPSAPSSATARPAGPATSPATSPVVTPETSPSTTSPTTAPSTTTSTTGPAPDPSEPPLPECSPGEPPTPVVQPSAVVR